MSHPFVWVDLYRSLYSYSHYCIKDQPSEYVIKFFITTTTIIFFMVSSFMWQDYTGEDVTVENFFAVILGNKTALTGGSGKVVDSGPNDHIFIFYSDHGGPGVLG